ncbi:hypothetical protein S7335_4255 [Synechococcus sp. PCC 7335]|nr:hypothetical protein S7335_4255 [Synechococcus sp. PCC 7335]
MTMESDCLSKDTKEIEGKGCIALNLQNLCDVVWATPG